MRQARWGALARNRESGYAMAALLVGMSIMAVLMTAALPSWTHMAQRDKEEEYLFRAKQYARAVRQFQDKNGGGMIPAPSVDFLIEQRFLRKKYKDPITGDDFVLIRQPTGAPPGFGQPGTSQPGSAQRPGQSTQRPGQNAQGQQTAQGQRPQVWQPDGQGARGSENGPFVGVTSKSKAQAIKLFKGQQTTYDQWQVTVMDVPSALARGAQGAAGAINQGGNLGGGVSGIGGGQNTFPGAGGQSPFAPGGGQTMPQFPGGAGGFGQPMPPPQGQGGSPFQTPGANQNVPKFPPLPNTTGSGPFQPTTPQPTRRPPG